MQHFSLSVFLGPLSSRFIWVPVKILPLKDVGTIALDLKPDYTTRAGSIIVLFRQEVSYRFSCLLISPDPIKVLITYLPKVATQSVHF